MILECLLALNFEVIGACRADERLKPLLKLNSSSSAAEGGLLSHLSQHFEPTEVGRLARCFCMPLVSIHLGKINKQGNLLCPATTRGNFNLTLLPTSDLHLSLIGHDGQDPSGSSFIIKLLDGRAFFFWCKLLGKIRDLVNRRPSVAQLTGIDESRLECFATYLMGSAICNTQTTPSSSPSVSTDLTPANMIAQSSSPSASKFSGSQLGSSEEPIRLGRKMSSSEEATFRCFLWSRSGITGEKLKKQLENPFGVVDHSLTASIFPQDPSYSKSGRAVNLEGSKVNSSSPGFLESIGKPAFLPSVLSISDLLGPFSIDSPLTPPTTESVGLADLPPFDFPAFLPDLPFSLPRSASQQVLTFTPLICDPIVHIPVIDVCSTGQMRNQAVPLFPGCGSCGIDAVISTSPATFTHFSLPHRDQCWGSPCSCDDNVNGDAGSSNPAGSMYTSLSLIQD
ncbi:hypothetical protein SAY86_025242 [Trapa natans]|uniref:Uncharacterized protein n=1 Tax=Trapa natans TaxID=22666 RepID=A0AAN7RDZ8_TRANT|nr:hypothetical protein SAY86_025242 [Trapa natans]